MISKFLEMTLGVTPPKTANPVQVMNENLCTYRACVPYIYMFDECYIGTVVVPPYHTIHVVAA